MRILLQAGMLLLGAAVTGRTQSLPNGRIDLRVSNESGGPIARASVNIDPNTPESQGPLEADSNGRLAIDVAAGLHEIRVSAPCFVEEHIESKVPTGETASIQISLALESVWESCIVEPDDPANTMPVETVPPGENKLVLISDEPLPSIPLKALHVKPRRFWHFWR